MEQPRPSIAVLGSGALARALWVRLEEVGVAPLRWARDPEALAPHSCATLEQVGSTDLALVCVSDRAIVEVAGALAQVGAVPSVVLHTSGFHGRDPLQALAEAGAAVGGLHPLISVPPGDPAHAAQRLIGAAACVFGDERALAAARALAERLGAVPVEVSEEQRPLYHAAAALASNGLVALFDLALDSATACLPAGTSQAPLRAGLAHLGQGVLENLAATGASDALTGPVPRGDDAVVAGHLDVLPAEAQAAYRALLGRMLKLARDRGVSAETLGAIEALLADS